MHQEHHDAPAAGPVPAAPPLSSPVGKPDRGSALIVSMMIMVILTMLGVTFAVLATQEEKISVNARDHQQTLYAAEAAVEIARSWFNDPSTTSNSFKPTSAQMNFELRRGRTFGGSHTNEAERDPSRPASDTDAGVSGGAGAYYSGGTITGSAVVFDKHFRGTPSSSLWGRPETPDVLICANLDLDGNPNDASECLGGAYIQRLNRSLLVAGNLVTAGHSTRDAGVVEIEQIRVYRPPVDFDLRTRYGVATVEATAVKRIGTQVVARKTVREVLQEIPFPGPSGAIEAEGEISADGSQGVHWGAVVSSSSTDDISLPAGNTANFPDAAVPRTSATRWGYHTSINPAAWTDRGAVALSVDDAVDYTPVATFLTEALGITRNGDALGEGFAAGGNFAPPGVPDPWLIFRARRRIVIGGTPAPTGLQPYPYKVRNPASVKNGPMFDNNSNSMWAHMFQSQVVRFPPMDYQTWKEVSQSNSNGMYYFKWDGSGGANSQSYKRDGIGPTRTWLQWLEDFDRGVFFFDTKDSTKPVYNTATPPVCTNCTETHSWDPGLYVEGFIYLNSTQFQSAGSGGGTNTRVNMPGEVFLDDGIDLALAANGNGDDCLCIRFDEIEGKCVLAVRPIRFPGCPATEVGDGCVCPPATLLTINDSPAEIAANRKEAETFRNGLWDSDINNDTISDALQDITAMGTAWTNFISNNEGANQGFSGGHGYNKGVLPGYSFTNRYRQGAATAGAFADWQRDPRFLNQITGAGWNATVGRQVHEPFLNFDSQSEGNSVATWGNDNSVAVNYRAQNDPVEMTGSTVTKYTTRSRDATGALMTLGLQVNGVMYCEGRYTGTGNLKVYGSLLMKGGYAGTGSVDVWFNEDLVKGKFPNTGWRLPRVYASARDTN